MNNRNKNIVYSLVLLAVFLAVYAYRNVGKEAPEPITEQKDAAAERQSYEMYVTGKTMGVVTYNVKYLDRVNRNFKAGIDSLLRAFNASLSTYIPDSEISRFNASADGLAFESGFFFPVLETSEEVFEATGGAFDPTVMPLVQLWGFGPGEKPDKVTDEQIAEQLQYVGFGEHIDYDEAGVDKDTPGVKLDFSAIAKGYAVDLVAEFLEKQGIGDYMVEIGGETACRGKNGKDEVWLIGLTNPKKYEGGQEAPAIVRLVDHAIATSGNYENFRIVDGKKYGHSLDPKTGRPVQHSLLQASVFAEDCMTADAYATAFMVMGLEKARQVLAAHPELGAIFVYDQEGELKTEVSETAKPYLLTELEADEEA